MVYTLKHMFKTKLEKNLVNLQLAKFKTVKKNMLQLK